VCVYVRRRGGEREGEVKLKEKRLKHFTELFVFTGFFFFSSIRISN